MDDSEYAIYEACSPMPTTHGTDVHKMGTVPNNFQIPSSPVISSVYISTSQSSQSPSPKNTLPVSNLAKESIPPLSNSESIDSSKASCISYINILPSNFLQNPVYSLQDEAIFEENKSRAEGVNTVVLPNSYGPADNSTFRLLLTPLQYSNLIKNNSSDKVVTQTLLLHSNLTSVDESSSTLAEEITNISNENLPSENPCSLAVNSSGNAKEKKGQAQSQVIIKPLQDDLSFDIVENISQNLDNSHIFEIIENEKECDINKLSQTKDADGDLSPGTFRFLLSPPINETERIVQSGDDIEDINTTFNIIYSCAMCNKFFSSEDLSIQHKKECVPPSYLNGSHLKRALLNNEDIFSEFPPSNNLSNDKEKCKLSPKSNIFWICLVCSQECGSTCVLRTHYESHSIEELASALLKCTTPCNVKNQKLISDQSTMTESLSNGSQKDEENTTISGLISNITVKENNYLENVKEEPVDLNSLRETVTVNNSKPVSTSLYTSLPEVKNKVPTKVNKKNKHNSKSKKKSKANDTGLKSRDPHSCPICNKFLSSRGNLSKHLIQHQAVKPWVCKVCGLGFNSKRNHDHHYLQRHTTLRPNVCNICGKGYTNKRTLSEHMIFHRKEKEFECQLCQKSFLTKKCLNRHMQRHETNRKFICKLCHKAFRVNVDLASHLKLVHSSDKKKKNKINSKPTNNIDHNRIVLNTNLPNPNIAETLKKNQHCPKSVSQPLPLVTDHTHLSMTSNAEQLNKLKDFSDLLQSNSNSLLPDIGHELQSPTLSDARETLFISGDSIDAQAVIPVTSTTDDLLYNSSYGFSLQNRTAILNQDLSSPSIYVMTGVSVAQNDNHTNSVKNSTVWHPGTELRTYQDSTLKEVPTTNSTSPSGTEIHLFPGVLESITRSYSDGLEQGESLKFEVAPNITSAFQKITRRSESTRNTCDKTFDSDLGANLVSEKSAVDALPNDNQTQSLNLDLLSQTLQLDFQPTHEHSGTAFI